MNADIWTARAVWRLKKLLAHKRSDASIASRLGDGFTPELVAAKRVDLNRRGTVPRAEDTAALKARRAAAGNFAKGFDQPGSKKTSEPIAERPHRGSVAPHTDVIGDRERCHWPVGDLKAPGFGYCGASVPEGSKQPYCAEHGERRRDKSQPESL